MQDLQTYRDRSHEFLTKAREEFQAGDLVQASEKGWGAAALMVKEVGDRRQIAHEKHGELHGIVRTLVAETGDRSLRQLFAVANDLHKNFYEAWLAGDDVAEGLDDVEVFVDKIEGLL